MAFLAQSACKKSTLAVDGAGSADPVFYVHTLDSVDNVLDLTAGVDNYYMFSDVEKIQNDTVLRYTATFGNRLPSLKFTLLTASQAPLHLDSVLSFNFLGSVAFTRFPMEIELIDEKNTIWTTNLTDQLPNSFFKVTSVADYDRNENNQATSKLTIEFDCILANENQQQLFLRGNGTIAVGRLE